MCVLPHCTGSVRLWQIWPIRVLLLNQMCSVKNTPLKKTNNNNNNNEKNAMFSFFFQFLLLLSFLPDFTGHFAAVDRRDMT